MAAAASVSSDFHPPKSAAGSTKGSKVKFVDSGNNYWKAKLRNWNKRYGEVRKAEQPVQYRKEK